MERFGAQGRERRRTRQLVLLVSWASLLGGLANCGRDKPETVPLDLSDYSVTCTQQTDCTVVDRLACATYCESDAVPLRADDVDRYTEQRQEHADDCRNGFVIDCVGEDDDSWVSNNIALCVDEQCTVRPRLEFRPDVNQTCNSDDDCHVVETSDPCECVCERMSVNAGTGGDIIRAREAVDCGMSVEECSEPCPNEVRPVCTDGECSFVAVE